jgi:very-short-patch-repair endonuclease
MARVIQQARRLRKAATRHEKRLWSHLRDRKLAGLKFRRQVPVGDRILDFFCAEAHLAVELDGSGHCHHFTQMSDLDRAIELHEKGIRIIRFYNSEVDENLDGVLNAILYAADPEKSLWASGQVSGEPRSVASTGDPHLDPLPQGEEIC